MAFFLRGDPELVDQRLVLVAVQTLAPAVLAGHVFLDAPVEGAERAPGPVAPLDEGIALAGPGPRFHTGNCARSPGRIRRNVTFACRY